MMVLLGYMGYSFPLTFIFIKMVKTTKQLFFGGVITLDLFLGFKTTSGWWFGTWLLFFHILGIS